jgi:DNA-binding NarL/FixJ family response regulator
MTRLKESATEVLVIDDTASARDRLERLLLELPNVAVSSCRSDPDLVLGVCRATQPDCIVMDVPLRGRDGLRLLAQLRQEAPDCQLIVLSNRITESLRFALQSLGISHRLNKVTDFERTPELVRSLTLEP